MGTGSFPGVKSGRGVTLTPQPLLVPWSWKGRAIPPLPLWAVRPVHSLSACTRVHITFYLWPCSVWLNKRVIRLSLYGWLAGSVHSECLNACLSNREMKLVGFCWSLDERWLVDEILADGTGILTSSESRMALNLLRVCSLAGSCRACCNSEAVLPAAPSYSIASISFMLIGDTTTLPGSWADRCWWQSKLQSVRNWILEMVCSVHFTFFPCSV